MALTEHSHTIIFPWGEDKKVISQKRDMRYAKDGELFMRCGHCGKTDFTILIKPNLATGAKITTACCSLCNWTFPFDDQGNIAGSFTITEEKADAKKREMINERPDT